MSLQHRQKQLWPSDRMAVNIWHMVAAAEDMADLAKVAQGLRDADARLVVMKKLLVDFKSFDDLVNELRATLSGRHGEPPPEPVRAVLVAAVRSYDMAMEPSRTLLARIRNNLGAHRRGLPGDAERRKFGQDFRAWGAWEQELQQLEKQCGIDRWIDAINAAIEVRNQVAELGLGAWHSVDGNGIRLYLPLRMDPGDDDSGPAG